MRALWAYQKRWRTDYNWYAWLGLTILLCSAIWWSLLGAWQQQGNADQLADGLLFEHSKSFAGALFPASHTLLLKWLIFLLLAMFHNAAPIYACMTILVVLLSVTGLAYGLHRIASNSLVFGTLCLGLACVLILVPAQLFHGPTAPLNMAMLTGRNVEYVVYLGVLVLYLRAQAYWSIRWTTATLALAVLFASDQLFVPLSIGGGLLLMVVTAIHRYQLRDVAKRWLWGTGLAWILARVLLLALGRQVHVIGDITSPYGFISNWHELWSGLHFAAKALLLNLGITRADGPLAIIPAATNLMVGAAMAAAGTMVTRQVLHNHDEPTLAEGLSLMLVASTAAAIILFVCTDHPYAADARYLTISLFAGFVTLATYLRSVELESNILLAAGGILALAIMCGLTALTGHIRREVAHDPLRHRNQLVAQALAKHPEEVLVGNYWRVLPIKALTVHADQNVMPLRSCLQASESLRSITWQRDLRRHSFAYLLSLRPDGTPFSDCTLHTVEFRYGKPTSSAIIAGNRRNPEEVLLFYDRGADDTDRL